MKYTPENIESLKAREIFVFGSNQAGIHGAGAAKKALEWGAIRGKGEGIGGQTYALPTKDRNIQVLPLETIKSSIDYLFHVILDSPHFHFLITKVGCGLAGFTPKQIAPMFKDFLTLQNVSLPEEFVKIITK